MIVEPGEIDMLRGVLFDLIKAHDEEPAQLTEDEWSAARKVLIATTPQPVKSTPIKPPVQVFVFVNGGLVDLVSDRYGRELPTAKIIDWDCLDEGGDECPVCHNDLGEDGDDILDDKHCPICGLDISGNATAQDAILAALRLEEEEQNATS